MHPLLPRALFGLAVAGVTLFTAWKTAQENLRSRDDPRFRPRGRRAAGADDAPPMNARAHVDRAALAQLRDALTGAALDPSGELFRCAGCQSFYGVASVRALANENGARCLNCGSIHRIPVEVGGVG
ncbi:MAG: hypothetical protein AB7P21_12760 [Lautropia sp.]